MAKKKLPNDVAAFFRAKGRKGGKRSLETMTADERKRRAKKAIKARWAKRREAEGK